MWSNDQPSLFTTFVVHRFLLLPGMPLQMAGCGREVEIAAEALANVPLLVERWAILMTDEFVGFMMVG